MQSRKGSFAESCISTGIGMFISLITQLIIFPLYGIKIAFHQNLQILFIFTIISVARQYFLRRIFNNIIMKRIIDYVH